MNWRHIHSQIVNQFKCLNLSKKKFIKALAFGSVSVVLLLSACSENITTTSTPENALAFDKSNSINGSAIVDNEPNGTVVSPPADITVNLGEQIYFAGSGFDPTGNYPLSYHWNFGSIQPSGLAQNPGYVTMNTLGTHRIILTVTNGLGVSDSTPEVRIINVMDPNSPNIPVDSNPLASIDSPVGGLVIKVGETVNFTGSGFSPAGYEPLTYLWNFSGAIPNSTLPNPGNVTFTQPGVYLVNLTVTDAMGVQNTNVATVTIIVSAEGVTNLAPTATILSPPDDLTIKVGDSLYFIGSANDADSNEPLNYSWDFGGAAPISNQSVPGKIMFSTPGVYAVRLMVTDSLGLSDANPPVRTITVSDVKVQRDMPLNTVIISPIADMEIMLGDSVNFQGEGNNGTLVEPLRYLWTFNNMETKHVTEQNPGNINFPRVGKFEVALIIADANGNVVTHETERKITVIDPNALSVHIHDPETHQTINVGQSISFVSMVNDPTGSGPYTYHWTFNGAAPDSMMPITDPITFNTAGIYKIRLSITDGDPNPLTLRRAKAETRIITVVDPDALQARITSPMSNHTINAGDVLTFAGEGIDPLGTAVLEYMWKFDGVGPDMAVQNPGDIIFSTPGKFRIEMIVRDSITLRQTRSNKITITVLDPTSLIADITSPMTDKLIYMGESVNFMGMGIDPLNDTTQFIYHWDFGRGMISTEQNPGPRIYNTPGSHEVEFHVDDPLTNRHSKEVEREINVMPIASMNPNPVTNSVFGTITSPLSNMTIEAGVILDFTASGFDPNGGLLSYHWNFGGAVPNATVQNPGAITFSQSGVYTIILTVKNMAGEIDPNPPTLIITVL